jgi:hypothetical protein
VSQAGVKAWEREDGEKYLAGYIALRKGCYLAVDELRRFLMEKLPDYMVPSAFVFFEDLPLTSGKLDRKALPRPENKRPELQQPYVSPRNELEHKLVQIWREVLEVSPIGINDHFLDLGGHSLAATRVVSRVIDTFQLNVRVKALFDSPTIADMALVIEQNRSKASSNEDFERMLSEIEAMSEEKAQAAFESLKGETNQR